MDDIASLEVRWIQGVSNSVVFVDNKTICYTRGSHLCFLNLASKVQSVLQNPGRGIGAFTADGSGCVCAFSEQKLLPSVFVYSFPELQVKNELKGTAQLDYTSLTLSNCGPYLGCCSSIPDYTITIWNWETAEPICTRPQAGKDVISLVFNPHNWLQLCALGSTSVTLWTVEKSAGYHALKPSVIDLPATDGTFVEKQVYLSHSGHNNVPYFGPEMPVTAISGLKGDVAESVVSKLCSKARLSPASVCWTSASQLYVGCAEGFLLLVDPESASVSVLFNPQSSDATPELTRCSFQSLTVCKHGLIVLGKESLVHCLQIKETQISITKTWRVEGSVTTLTCSPDSEYLLLYSNTSQIYVLNPVQSDSIVKRADVVNGNFVAAAVLQSNNIFVLVTDSGELQVCSAVGVLLSSLALQAQGTSLACCPIAQYAAVGTTSGRVLFIDLNNEQQPRLVHQVQLYRCTVDHLIFDPEGHYLLTGASDSHIFLLDAKPSNSFSVIGYTVAPGAILSLSLQCTRGCEQVKVLALCSGREGERHEGSVLTLLTLPKRSRADPVCVDRYGCLSTSTFKASTYEVPHPVSSCVLGDHEVFAYCHRRKSLQRFPLPQDTDDASRQVVHLEPQQEVGGHPLGPASLALSAHQLWLASIGRDGLLRVRETASMERYVELQCHSCRLGGFGNVCFSADSQTLITAGFRDGSAVCSILRNKCVDGDKVKEAALYDLSMAHYLRNVFHKENLILTEMPEWESERELRQETDAVDVTVQRGSGRPPLQLSAPPSHPTWLESRHRAVIEEDNEKLSETKTNLRKTIRELCDTIQQMMLENEDLPDVERLEQHEFNLDTEEQKRLDAEVDEEVSRVRDEMEWEILTKCYLYDVLKRQCWDSVMTKGRSVEAFHSDLKVKNYALRARTEQDMEDLRMVHNMRTIEKAASASNLKDGSKEVGSVDDGKEESAALTGSFSAQLGYSNPYVYDQFSLKTTEQRINQITLLQDVIYCIKTAFNAEFEAVHRQKVQELNRVRDRNRQIGAIMLALNSSETLWEPGLSRSEWPERMLTVDEAEIKAQKHLTPEQKEEEKRRKLEEQQRLAAKGDNSRDRALSDMMDGVLQVKKVDILKMEIPPPEFVLTKSDIDWSEEEKKAFKEFEKKTKDLNEEKEKYKKLLEAEIKKLQAASWDATEGFDETLTKLFEKKVRCETAIYQEELKISCLVCSVLTEEEMRNRELELKLQLDKMLAYKDEIAGDLKKHEEELELFQETFDSIVAEDKVLDKEFRKDFFDVPTHMVDHLYKLFKRRPRVQKVRAQAEKNLGSLKEQRLCASLAPEALGKMLKAMEELDAAENAPEGLNPSIWERFCLVRRTKVESEQKVKVKALTLAEMKTFLQKKRDEERAAQQEAKHLSDKLESDALLALVLFASSLHKERTHFQTDIMVQILLKQGQGEVSTTGLTPDYTHSVLQHRSVVEDLNRTIRMLAEQKIASMVERKDFRKGIIRLEWDNKMRRMQIEDFINKTRDIQMLQLSEEQQDYLQKTDQDSRVSKQVSILEKTIDFQEKTHLQNVQHRMKKTAQLKRQAAVIASKNTALDQQLSEMQVTVAERKHICEEIASEENEAAKSEERYQEILQKRNLENLARAQAEELAFFGAELERLRMKNFPSLDKLQHN
ncbi:cilia- and flagella-associated protein 43 isoform X2 [Betta splendens]|uniref:Cilia- and flagella-associated protein 43 n=1 Tax=Betta splendens TaxID=158456 RepID=A0A9W2X9J1_BETSP|nr:cilia- and flagella-associated protein 43 isoform X2 [Betta splendens]